MLRAFTGGPRRGISPSTSTKWQILRNQYRQLAQAIRFGDLSAAKVSYDLIRFEQSDADVLSSDAELAFDALGDAIESGSLADAADGLRLLRLVLESSRDSYSRRDWAAQPAQEDRPAETLRSGFIPGHGADSHDELPETATIPNINLRD